MPGPNTDRASAVRRAAAAGILPAIAVLTIALLAIAAGQASPAEARRKIATPDARPAPFELFGRPATAYPPSHNFAKWSDMLARYEQEQREAHALCRRGACALLRWHAFLAGLRHAAPMAQLRAVNARLNRLSYKTDAENYGVEDYWATPREFFARGGDCEDYALAKYFSLRALGWPADRLRIVVVQDRERDLVHAALVAYHRGVAYLLDIEVRVVTDHRRVARYLPIFAINESGWWSYDPAPADRARPAGDRARPQTGAEQTGDETGATGEPLSVARPGNVFASEAE